jgi:hypothetical protein
MGVLMLTSGEAETEKAFVKDRNGFKYRAVTWAVQIPEEVERKWAWARLKRQESEGQDGHVQEST